MGILCQRVLLQKKTLSLVLAMFAFFLNAQAQIACPENSECRACVGGLTSLTIRYTGTTTALITIEDKKTVIFSEQVDPDEDILIEPDGQNFKGNILEVSINTILNTTINSKCNVPLFINSIYGDFIVVAGESKQGGSICCIPEPGDAPFEIAKVITPNGDGLNDTWILLNIEMFSDNNVTVFDRWGNIVFRASGYNNQSVVWAGQNQGGGNAPTGTYFFTFIGHIGSQVVDKRGSIELIR